MSLFQSPFDELGPPPRARQAAESFMRELEVEGPKWFAPGAGKMFGILLARRPDGSLEELRAFSGLLDGRWIVPGFVPPMFDVEARAAIEVPGEAAVKALTARVEAHASDPGWLEARREWTTLEHRQRERLDAMKREHDRNRLERRAIRDRGASPDEAHELDQQSRRDKAERRKLDAAHVNERTAMRGVLARFERRQRALERLRRIVCRRLMQALHDTYGVRSARGERRTLRSLFSGREPPSGAGDCAAPKLLAEAFRRGWEPIELAEFWWGAPPLSGGRVSGAFYSACREKCGPILPFMLDGLEVAPPRELVSKPENGLRIVFEDDAIVVVDKPAGLLSVPGRGEALLDSVLHRLRERYGEAWVAHRLDLDTSGLLVGAKTEAAYKRLQRRFAAREVRKRYVAVVERVVDRGEGVIELPMRLDPENRPRQVFDPVEGKPAVTRFRRVSVESDRTRVELEPVTGRTHQLRVHCAHPLGLNAPIVGDRLYGRGGGRLLLHAKWIAFDHPESGVRVELTSPAPF